MQIQPHHRECEGNGRGWQRIKVFIKNDPVIVFVSKPRDVNNLLYGGVLVWVLRPSVSVRNLCNG